MPKGEDLSSMSGTYNQLLSHMPPTIKGGVQIDYGRREFIFVVRAGRRSVEAETLPFATVLGRSNATIAKHAKNCWCSAMEKLKELERN